MKKSIIVATVALAAVTATVPAHAQDFNWMGSHLDAQIFGNQMRSNQQTPQGGGRRSGTHKKRKLIVKHPQVQVNGQPLKSSLAPVSINGHTFVPMRSLFEALGFTVTHDSEKRRIIAKRGGDVMQIVLPGGADTTEGWQRAFQEGEMPFIRKGVTMLPLRKMSETVGAQVTYVPRSTPPLISITSKAT